MYGGQTAGMFGYSHFTGGFAGGQAEYVRVPLADVNLLPIPDDVPEEKALYLSDVLATSYHCVRDTGVRPGDEVAIFGAGPIGQMAGLFAVADTGASKVIYVDTEPRLSLIKDKWPAEHADKLELVDFGKLSSGVTSKPTVVSTLKELCGGRGPDCALECAAGEYPKGWLHWLEMAVGAETDTSELVNEMIEGVRNYGRCGITGVYAGYVSIDACLASSYSKKKKLTGGENIPDKPLQHRLSHGARHPAHRQRPSPRPYVLGGAAGQDPAGQGRPAADGVAPGGPGRPGAGVLQV